VATALIVPMGIERWASARSPERFDPAIMPATTMESYWLYICHIGYIYIYHIGYRYHIGYIYIKFQIYASRDALNLSEEQKEKKERKQLK
jgi:hypothetical protein